MSTHRSELEGEQGMPNVMDLAQAEREDLAGFLEELGPGDWTAPTLCTEWSVHDVAAHTISFEPVSWPGLVALAVSSGFSPGRMNDRARRPLAQLPPDELVALVRERRRPRGLTAMMGGTVALTDGLIHHQDIRRALGRPRTVPAERLRPALDTAVGAPTLPSRKHVRGLALRADDLDWSRGDGPEVTGPAEALLMVIAGRPAALDDLAGDGLPTLRQRLAA